MIEITFDTENVGMPPIDKSLIRLWVEKVASRHNRLVGRIAYVFTDDERILEVNKEFLQHDYYTDIITFDYSRRRLISGDLFISLDTVRTNAEKIGADYETELHRVIIHGILHLCGINDKAPGEREIMEAHEDKALSLLHELRLGANG